MRSIYIKRPEADSVIREPHVYGGLKWVHGQVHNIKDKRWGDGLWAGRVRTVAEGGVGGVGEDGQRLFLNSPQLLVFFLPFFCSFFFSSNDAPSAAAAVALTLFSLLLFRKPGNMKCC